jgi:hypothetical protein
VEEEWRAVVGYEGLYEVSSLGRVRALKRIVDGRWGKWRLQGGVMKKIVKRVTGYEAISLCSGGVVRQFSVHRLVLEAFVGRRPKGMEACHWDGNRTNSALANLRWDTRRNNAVDRKRHGTDLLGERAKSARLTRDLVLAIRRRDKPATQWAKELGVGLQTVCRARLGQTWAWLGKDE